MRNVPQAALDLITQPKEVSLRATFRDTLPRFVYHSLTDSQGLVDPAWIDACVYQTGILRVMTKSNVLYTQYVSNINGTWPVWQPAFSTYPGSQPAVDGGYIYYQAINGDIVRYYYSDWAGTNTIARNMPGAVALAPIETRCWALWQRYPGSFEIVSMNGQESSQYTIYGPTTRPRIDAVSFNGKEYFYTMDRDEGRVIEIVHAGNSVSGQDSYGVAKSVIPIDAIDDTYGLKLGFASVIDNKVVVTGRLTRTSDDDPVSFDAYAIGPEYFSFGREIYIQGGYNVMGKMLRVGDTLIVPGARSYWTAKATTLFGGTGHSDLEATSSDLALATLTEAEGRSSSLNLDLSTDLHHSAIAVGSDLVLEMAYNNNWTKLTTCDVAADQSTSFTNGQGRVVSGVGKSARRLAQWSPDQGVYLPSQAKSYDFASAMTHVVRATGQWDKTSPDDEDSPLYLKGINQLGVLYSTNRASRGGAMRGRFLYESDTNFKPYYGVAINYYRETAAEAAERLSVEVDDLTDDMFGHNGIVAIYSKTEHNGADGVCLYLWKDSSLTKLTSASLIIPANTWHWLQIDFVEGEIRVKYRLASSTAWTEVIAFNYNHSTLPWKRETFGRGAIVVKNIAPSIKYYGLSSSDDTLAVDDNTVVPSTGLLMIDDEIVTYNGRSAYDLIRPSGAAAGEETAPLILKKAVKPDNSFTVGERVVVEGNPYPNRADHTFTGAALVAYKPLIGDDGPLYSYGINNTFRIRDYDGVAPEVWAPSVYAAGWSNFIGTAGYGSWWIPGDVCAFYVTPDPTHLLSDGGEMHNPPVSYVMVKPALYLTARGASGTTASLHEEGTAHFITGKHVWVCEAGCYTQDEDQSMEDGLKTIVGLAGGQVSCKALVDKTQTFAAAGLTTGSTSHRNFIATFDLPALTTGQGVGMMFRCQGMGIVSGWPSVSSGNGYYLEVQRVNNAYNLVLYGIGFGSHTEIENVPIRPTNLNGAATANTPVGTIRVSVQDNDFSVWLNGRYLHTFHNEDYPDTEMVGFVARQACSMKIHLSELDDLLADIVVGTRGNGMSVISELLADRHILWRDDPDGSMYFYRTRSWAGQLPDFVISVQDTTTDDIITRMRAEGLKISEILDADLIGQYGNIFATVNARFANTVLETRNEAGLLIDEAWRRAQTKVYSLILHPGIQPGDGASFDENGNQYDMLVRSQSITIGFSGNICDMQCEVVPQYRG